MAKFRVDSLKLGEETITACFPYKGILSSSIKITTGIARSLAGIKSHTDYSTHSAWKYWGPLIDIFGNVIGVIVSKLNSEFMI